MRAAELYVSTSGTQSGPGTMEQPFDLMTAFSGQVSQPGDTFWLLGGNYAVGHIDTSIQGAAGNPITFCQMPGEKARVDGSIAFFESEGYVILRDFELYSSDTNRASSQVGVGFEVTDIQIIPGISSFAPNLSFINLTVHDQTRHGIYISRAASNNVVYGCVIYNNGWTSPDNAEGHGLSVQGTNGTTEVSENVVFNNSGATMHVYEDFPDGQLTGVTMDGNVAFGAGAIQNVRPYRDWIVGADAPALKADRIVFNNNMGYVPAESSVPEEVQIGRQGVNGSVSVLNNYLPQGLWMNNWSHATVTGNVFATQREYLVRLDQTQAALQAQWNQNSYCRFPRDGDFLYNGAEYDFAGWRTATGFDQSSTYSPGRPSGTKVFLRPNRYENGRANIIVYNWDKLSRVAVDVSSVLVPGAAYEVRNAQDFMGEPVLRGTFDGRPLELPMTGLTVATPNGPLLTPASTGPMFNAFVLLSRFVRLAIVSMEDKVEISWPTKAGRWVLQFNASMTGDWRDFPNGPAVRGDSYVVHDSFSESRFYRLRTLQ